MPDGNSAVSRLSNLFPARPDEPSEKKAGAGGKAFSPAPRGSGCHQVTAAGPGSETTGSEGRPERRERGVRDSLAKASGLVARRPTQPAALSGHRRLNPA
jgi:hypothetical protein